MVHQSSTLATQVCNVTMSRPATGIARSAVMRGLEMAIVFFR